MAVDLLKACYEWTRRALWVPSSTVVVFLFSCIQVFSTFCNSDLFDLSPCRSSCRSFKAVASSISHVRTIIKLKNES